MQNPSGRKGVCGSFSETKKAREVHRNTGFWAGERFCMDEFEKQITEAPNLTLTSSNPANSRKSLRLTIFPIRTFPGNCDVDKLLTLEDFVEGVT